jgi:sodium-dependent dicarboxylate transporter 2/3/5
MTLENHANLEPELSGRRVHSPRQRLGLLGGILFFVVILLIPTPQGLTAEAQRAAAVAVLMATWWISEALPLYATALVPLLLFPLLGVLDLRQTSANYAEPTVFLFMGGFFLAMAMERWGLHRRIALFIIRLLGTQPRRLVLGFMVATAVMSMWVSNTTTTLMVYPIGLAVISQLPSGVGQRGFGVAIMLGIAYAASIGGVGTIIGTPPNAIFVGQAQLLFPELPGVSFFQWMLIGVPYVLIFLPLTWLYLTLVHIRKIGPGADSHALREELERLGPPSRGEYGVFFVFVFAVFGWVFRNDLQLGLLTLPGWAGLLGVGASSHDATVAMAAALLLFLIPVDANRGEFLLNWEWAVRIPWGVLILFGGGFALAESFQKTGLALWLTGGLGGWAAVPLPLLILMVCLFVTFLSELVSNTAIAAIMMPILGATASAIGVHPYLLMIPATIAASSGFMLPVATPPNAIIFGSGYLKITEMVKAGFVLNLTGAILITLLVYFLAAPLLQLSTQVGF